jgi:hypothetical protein
MHCTILQLHLSGAGIDHAFVYAMMTSLPVVATPLGGDAFENRVSANTATAMYAAALEQYQHTARLKYVPTSCMTFP